MYYICNTYKISIKSLIIASNPKLIKIERNRQYCHGDSINDNRIPICEFYCIFHNIRGG